MWDKEKQTYSFDVPIEKFTVGITESSGLARHIEYNFILFMFRLLKNNEIFMTLNDIRKAFMTDQIRSEFEMCYGIDTDNVQQTEDWKKFITYRIYKYRIRFVVHGIKDLRHFYLVD